MEIEYRIKIKNSYKQGYNDAERKYVKKIETIELAQIRGGGHAIKSSDLEFFKQGADKQVEERLLDLKIDNSFQYWRLVCNTMRMKQRYEE